MVTYTGPAFHFTVTQSTFRKGSSSLLRFPRTFSFLKGKGHVPNFKNECLLPTVFAAFRAALPHQTPPWKLRGAWSLLPEDVLPTHQDTAATGIDQRACFYIRENE